MSSILESLPVELIADVLSELDLRSLVTVSCLSRRLHQIASDPSLNPWRPPILRNLRSDKYEECFRTLSIRSTVPRYNWLDIISIARPEFLLFDATLPNLPEADWRECFERRFLPGWTKWRKPEGRWKEAFLKTLSRVWHRTVTSCTTDEAWTKYIVLNRNGSANLLEGSSRNFNPLAIFNEMKLQSNLTHLETHVRLLIQLADVRILALGVLHRPRSNFSINDNARSLLHPPGVNKDYTDVQSVKDESSSERMSIDIPIVKHVTVKANPPETYTPLTHPLPVPSHRNYPLFTPGGEDKRWLGSGELEEKGRHWVGGLMLTAQLTTPQTRVHSPEGPPLQDLDLVVGPGRSQYASFTWADLVALAPWMKDSITKRIDGPGLGL